MQIHDKLRIVLYYCYECCTLRRDVSHIYFLLLPADADADADANVS
jgi:hypothetical protein